MVPLRVGSSKQSSLFRQLAEALPALLRLHPHTVTATTHRQRQRRLTPKQIAQLVAEYEGGDAMAVLAARWGLHRSTVAGHLRGADVTLRRQDVPAERIDEAVVLYGKGWSCQRLAERFRCDDETVRQTLTRAGVKMRAPWDRR